MSLEDPEQDQRQLEAIKHFQTIYHSDKFYETILLGLQRDPELGLLNQQMLHDLGIEASKLGFDTDFRNHNN